MSEWERREVVSCMSIRHKVEIKVVDFAHASSRAQRKMCKRSNPPRSNRELSWTNLDCQGGRKGLPACGTAGRMCRVSGSENVLEHVHAQHGLSPPLNNVLEICAVLYLPCIMFVFLFFFECITGKGQQHPPRAGPTHALPLVVSPLFTLTHGMHSTTVTSLLF
jgi:hypothetical protein